MDRLITINELAELTGLSVNTIYNKKGGTRTLSRVRLGRKLMFRLSDVERWIERGIEAPHKLRIVARSK